MSSNEHTRMRDRNQYHLLAEERRAAAREEFNEIMLQPLKSRFVTLQGGRIVDVRKNIYFMRYFLRMYEVARPVPYGVLDEKSETAASYARDLFTRRAFSSSWLRESLSDRPDHQKDDLISQYRRLIESKEDWDIPYDNYRTLVLNGYPENAVFEIGPGTRYVVVESGFIPEFIGPHVDRVYVLEVGMSPIPGHINLPNLVRIVVGTYRELDDCICQTCEPGDRAVYKHVISPRMLAKYRFYFNVQYAHGGLSTAKKVDCRRELLLSNDVMSRLSACEQCG